MYFDMINNQIIAYTSAIPSRKNWDLMYNIYPKWRFMLSPDSRKSFGLSRFDLLKKQGFAIDNGAYLASIKSKPFNEKAYFKLLDEFGDYADFVVIPDAVGDWEKTKRYFEIYKYLTDNYNCYFVVQDDAELDILNVSRMLEYSNIFIGGTTNFKLNNLKLFCDLARKYRRKCHVGRVNSQKRIEICINANAHSFDGSLSSRFASKSKLLSKYLVHKENQLQLDLF